MGKLVTAAVTVYQATTVTQGADLALGFTAPADIRSGEILTFNAVITNNGPYPATGTTFTTVLPAALSADVTLPPGCASSRQRRRREAALR